jgi:hypothetical protein
LVLDFGYKGENSWSDFDQKKNIIDAVIGDNVLEAKMVTSHNDSDHNNLIGGPVKANLYPGLAADPVRSLSGEELGPVGKQLFAKINENREEDNPLLNIQRLEGGFGTKQQAQNFLDGSLGDGVTVKAIRPSEYRKKEEAPSDNNRNLIIKVTYGGKNLMFLGDAPSSLFSDIEESDGKELDEEDKKADFILTSHHGSDANDERGVLYKVANKSEKAPVVVISSNPRAVDKLPKSSTIDHLLEWYKPEDRTGNLKENKTPQWNHEVKNHNVKVSGGNGFKPTIRPIFGTSSALKGYYSLVIKSEADGDGENNSMKMYDGDPDIEGADNLLDP